MPMSTKCPLALADTMAVVQLPLLPTKQVELARIPIESAPAGETTRPLPSSVPANTIAARYFEIIDVTSLSQFGEYSGQQDWPRMCASSLVAIFFAHRAGTVKSFHTQTGGTHVASRPEALHST